MLILQKTFAHVVQAAQPSLTLRQTVVHYQLQKHQQHEILTLGLTKAIAETSVGLPNLLWLGFGNARSLFLKSIVPHVELRSISQPIQSTHFCFSAFTSPSSCSVNPAAFRQVYCEGFISATNSWWSRRLLKLASCEGRIKTLVKVSPSSEEGSMVSFAS